MAPGLLYRLAGSLAASLLLCRLPPASCLSLGLRRCEYWSTLPGQLTPLSPRHPGALCGPPAGVLLPSSWPGGTWRLHLLSTGGTDPTKPRAAAQSQSRTQADPPSSEGSTWPDGLLTAHRGSGPGVERDHHQGQNLPRATTGRPRENGAPPAPTPATGGAVPAGTASQSTWSHGPHVSRPSPGCELSYCSRKPPTQGVVFSPFTD